MPAEMVEAYNIPAELDSLTRKLCKKFTYLGVSREEYVLLKAIILCNIGQSTFFGGGVVGGGGGGAQTWSERGLFIGWKFGQHTQVHVQTYLTFSSIVLRLANSAPNILSVCLCFSFGQVVGQAFICI